MRIIKLNATDSTNTYLKQLSVTEALPDYTTVMTTNQTSGQGQMGNTWETEAGKNLTASVFVDVSFLKIDSQYFISMATSLALVKTLKQFSVPKLKIKWPNDILSENKKICGVLIENIVKNNKLQSTIIGIGLNVNQTYFNYLPQASSLKKITKKDYDIDELLLIFITNFKAYFKLLECENFNEIKTEYEALLYRKNKPSKFRDNENNLFSGYIKSVTHSGKLVVLLENNQLRDFNLKEITLLY